MSAKRQPVFASVRNEIDFPRDEAAILELWKARGIFDKTLRAETRATGPSRGTYVFYEGPPTANGVPHNGHVLTRAMKDVFPRYRTMCGYDVPRKAGWDTHGLPVEVEVEKDLGIHGKADIERYGVEPFIARCIESVFRYTDAWEKVTEKIGFWVDLPSAYVTYHRSYVESVWWALSVLHQKKLLYRGHKVVWWWPQGGTALSAAEVGSSYKSVDDPSAFVAFPLVDVGLGEEGVALCVWTTTPWTLPSNGYAAVKPDVVYADVRLEVPPKKGSDAAPAARRLVVAKALLPELVKKLGATSHTVVRELAGTELVGRRYQPPFDTFAKALGDTTVLRKDGTRVHPYFRVIGADFVTLDTGTGIVHVAPAFGEDDFVAHKAELARLASPAEVPLLCGVEPDGKLGAVMGPLAGTFVKDADAPLLADLEARGLLVHAEKYRHDYPFCWRADDDPLIQLARPAWYIRTTERIGDAIRNNRTVRWLPEHIQEGRFGDFLANNVDWALSRERYWGTPLNVWVCEKDESHELAPTGTADILQRNPRAFDHFHAAKQKDPSLNDHLVVHKPWIDQVTLPCPHCGATMRRVPEVIDCWFDSGCMPFAQYGFPHAAGSVAAFDRAFPADFISEAIDQTRGWFYSLLMIATLVCDDETLAAHGIAPRAYPVPYKSCVVLGHVCDKEGKKESKSRGNYTPPDIILERVRMEFAALDVAKTKVHAPKPDVAYVAREDYEGLDLEGERATVRLYRADREAEARVLSLEPSKALPRRVVALPADALAALGVTSSGHGLTGKPSDVPRLPQGERLFVEDPSHPAPGADAFRWFFYAASPPWSSTRHSLSNVRLQQKDFLVKLRNVYAFFCIYANIDGFSPAAGNAAARETTPAALAASTGYRPARERSELDRFILAELALTVGAVRQALDELRSYDAARRLVDFVEALSNWYVRRSRARFWASADDPAHARDKADASYTLYEVLVTTAKLIAPFTPYFAEEMYQNLVRRPWPASQPESVHLCAYPEPDAAALDAELALDMRAVRALVSLGLQVRADAKIKVRQPLARADVVVASTEVGRELRRHEALVAEELAVHEVRWLAPGEEAGAVRYDVKPNFRALGPRIGKKVQAVKQALARANAAVLAAELQAHGQTTLDVDGEPLALSNEEIEVVVGAAPGFAAASGPVGVVVLHTTIDDALRDEGLRNEVLARLQALRKELKLEYTERIALWIDGTERLRAVVLRFLDHIRAEALASSLEVGPGPADATRVTASLQGEDVVIAVRRAR
ncbi:MAG: class I tRNA ligase family protein [Myxococcales bacterium]|nr:class I tRNA ligase family protein [Myxococcales bacterium]